MYAPPTKRELVLITLLFTTLLFLCSGNKSISELSRIDLSTVWHDVSPPLHSQGIPTLPSQSRLSWGSSQVPRTKIITHAPGTSPFVYIHTMLTPDQDGPCLIKCIFSMAPSI